LEGQDIRPLYGKFGWAYDLVVPRPAGGSVERIARTFAALGATSGSLVIDAGCGTGRYSEGLAGAGFRVLGVERSEALVQQARTRTSGAQFICSDMLTWCPPELAEAVLCRGVLNDLTADSDRQAALAAFGSWLRDGGFLLADVREWEATAARYAAQPRYERSVEQSGRRLRFVSEASLDDDCCLMHVKERYVGTVDGVEVDETHVFMMRCWTADELSAYLAKAGFTGLQLRLGATAGIAPDRLLVTARK
jgi:SAM-dependent methyltransferase